MTLTTREEAEYLRACAALGIDPGTGQKNGNGRSTGLAEAAADAAHKQARQDEERDRANFEEWQRRESARQAKERIRRENLDLWIEHHDRKARFFYGLYMDHEERVAKLLQTELGINGQA